MIRFLVGRDWLAVWILWSTWCAVTGWALSLFDELDRRGYILTTGLFLLAIAFTWRHLREQNSRPPWLIRRSTYRHGLPVGWVVLALMALAGGLIYHPDNYDYLSYRFPRVLNWWWVHHWFWIDTVHQRQNYSGVGMEWLMTPLFVLFQSDRLFFLLNYIPYLLLPGLFFSVLRQFGVSGRVAWTWMWVLPAGLCFSLQAASMGNDTFSAVYFLAALLYALRTSPEKPLALPLSLLAMALVTGAKASNLPLVLPWVVVVWRQRALVVVVLRSRWRLLLGTVPVAALASLMPLIVANVYFTGSATGDPLNAYNLQIKNPIVGVAGNTMELIASNLSPPVWPKDPMWPGEARLALTMREIGYPRFEFNSRALPLEENVGLGLGVTAFAVVTLIYGLTNRAIGVKDGWFRPLFVAAALATTLAYLTKMGSEAAPRLFAVYYVLILLTGLTVAVPEGRVVRRRGWQIAAGVALLAALPGLIFNPARPLLPEALLVTGLRSLDVPTTSVQQLEGNFKMRALRRDWFEPLREQLPPNEKLIGCLTGEDDPEVAPWLPFGSRGVIEVTPDTLLTARGLHYVVVNGDAAVGRYHLNFPELVKKWGLQIVSEEKITFKSVRHPDAVYLLGPQP